jgi:hypothetical protein
VFRSIGRRYFFFATAQAWPNQPPIEWITGIPPVGTKRVQREADYFPSSYIEIKNGWSYTAITHMSSFVVLKIYWHKSTRI